MPKLTTVSLTLALSSLGLLGCMTAGEYREQADEVAYDIIAGAREAALGDAEPFTIAPPAEALRQKLLVGQNLPFSHPASLGTHVLAPIAHWPDDDYLGELLLATGDIAISTETEPLSLSLEEALMVAARHNRDYQTSKENIYRTALALDLERDEFRNTFRGVLETMFSLDAGDPDIAGVENSAGLGLSRRFLSGVEFTTNIAVDLVKLLTQSESSSLGIFGDASISIPLLRGSGRHIVGEPLTQAERNVLYAVLEFERFKRSFAVDVASAYLNVLAQRDQVANAEENYRRLIESARRARRLADAGRLPEIQVDQAVQDELRARNRWISAQQAYESTWDSFKLLLGLPADAHIDLEHEELPRLVERYNDLFTREALTVAMERQLPADPEAPIVLQVPNRDVAGPLEIPESEAIRLALDNRLDLRVRQGEVFDAQRQVVVAADGLRAELNLFGSASLGEGRSLSSADLDDADFDPEKGFYSALLSVDLPLERTAERNVYRNAWINLERATRGVQDLEDRIKLDVRNHLRDLLEFRETLLIQAQAVEIAERRVSSTDLFLQAGRAEIRDVLEAQEALISAQNALTNAIINYRIAELEFQRDLGLLEVNGEGLWNEFDPEHARYE